MVAGAKGVVSLADRSARTASTKGSIFYGGQTLPEDLLSTLTQLHGPFPKTGIAKPTRDDWTTDVLFDPLWRDGVPEFTLLWMNEPDSSQHATYPGSERSLAAIRDDDENLARVLQVLEAKGVRDSTDIFIVSDHGATTVANQVDLAAELKQVGIKAVKEFKSKPAPGEVIVLGGGGSVLVYVVGHDRQADRPGGGVSRRLAGRGCHLRARPGRARSVWNKCSRIFPALPMF